MSTKFEVDDFDNDFGFSAVSEDELKSLERQQADELQQKDKQLEQIETTYKGKLEQLYKTIIPLLKNLAKDDDKDYIYWPNRKARMEKFIHKIDRIVG